MVGLDWTTDPMWPHSHIDSAPQSRARDKSVPSDPK